LSKDQPIGSITLYKQNKITIDGTQDTAYGKEFPVNDSKYADDTAIQQQRRLGGKSASDNFTRGSFWN